MIRQTLGSTKLATFSIDVPNPNANGMPTPRGTGFFVSPDGWFITAAHVVTQEGTPTGTPLSNVESFWLIKENNPGTPYGGMCQKPKLDHVAPEFDLALLKVDFVENADKAHLKGLSGFPHLVVSSRQLDDGEPVYSFGYPLSGYEMTLDTTSIKAGFTSHCPRTTSAIVASTMEATRMVSSSTDPRVYVLDKALNYGNSGGPIVASDTGRVHALCSRFQPLRMAQNHLRDKDGSPLVIQIPSLYGVVSGLQHPKVLELLADRGIPVDDI